ncbi:MAG: hypothetical protein B7Z72_14180, partial [Gemmatimonadetes bacterium 21-71-4]
DPEGYLSAAARLGVAPRDCLVLEDSPTGLAAAKAAGMRVIALLTTHAGDDLEGAEARLASLATLGVAFAGSDPSRLTLAWST